MHPVYSIVFWQLEHTNKLAITRINQIDLFTKFQTYLFVFGLKIHFFSQTCGSGEDGQDDDTWLDSGFIWKTNSIGFAGRVDMGSGRVGKWLRMTAHFWVIRKKKQGYHKMRLE